MEFAEWIRTNMEQRSWSQSEMARRMEVDPGTLGNVLNGNRQAGPDFCIAVARALGVPREEVFRARGWLLREPKQVISSDADPRLVKMAEAVRHLPLEKRDQILAAWDATLTVAGVTYEHISLVDPTLARWQISPEEVAKMPAWKRGLWTVFNGLTLLNQKTRANELAQKYPVFQEAISNGRNPLILIDRLMEIGDALDALSTREERESYLDGWQDSDPDIYEIAKSLSDSEGRILMSELGVGGYWGA